MPPRWFPKLILVLALTALLLEAVLQAAALLQWSQLDETTELQPGTPVVLCVGDSFTYGLGASGRETAYPGVLQGVLQEQLGDDWRVVNKGLPGQTSRAVLERIDAQLLELRPRAVCVLVGINDHWSKPEELRLPPLDPARADRPSDAVAFRWEWRTLRLLRTAAGWLWQPESATDDERESAVTLVDVGRQRLEEGDFAAAESLFEQAIAVVEPADRPAVLLDFAILYGRWGKVGRATEYCERLRALYEAEPDVELGITYVEALVGAGRDAQARALEEEMLRGHPTNSRLLIYHADHLFRAGDRAAAIAEVERAVAALEPQGEAAHRAYVWRRRAEFYAATDAYECLRSIVAAHAADPKVSQARGLIQLNIGQFDRRLLQRAFAAVEAAPAVTAELRGYFDAAQRDTYSEQVAVIRSHVHQLRARCASLGAKLVILSYPRPDRGRVLERIAAELGVPWVPVHDAIAAVLARDPGADLFMADGHCNDAGYAVMARRVAAALVPLLRG